VQKESVLDESHLVDEIRVGACHFDGVGGALRIQHEGMVEVVLDEAGVDLPFWEDSGWLFLTSAHIEL
jgi:hypothetical protein